ncbi:MAG TPA: response regulator [Terriglobales bacterium]|nr:response regulator [Terriglobales bacterium]
MSFTLLCIDDEPNVLAVRKMLLESVGYRVLLAESGPLGLETLQREHVQTVIVDYKMPQMTGSEVAARIRQTHPGMPIIMLSAFVDLTPEQLKDVDAYVTKGESPDVLLQTIENVQPRKMGHGC